MRRHLVPNGRHRSEIRHDGRQVVIGQPLHFHERQERTSIVADTEVVIERIEDDVAYVEAWQEVEKRL